MGASEEAVGQLLAAVPSPTVPSDPTARAPADLQARAVAISVSRASRGRPSATLPRRLRDRLPRRLRLVVGGEGAPAPGDGIEVVTSLRALDVWGRRLAVALPPSE